MLSSVSLSSLENLCVVVFTVMTLSSMMELMPREGKSNDGLVSNWCICESKSGLFNAEVYVLQLTLFGPPYKASRPFVIFPLLVYPCKNANLRLSQVNVFTELKEYLSADT